MKGSKSCWRGGGGGKGLLVDPFDKPALGTTKIHIYRVYSAIFTATKYCKKIVYTHGQQQQYTIIAYLPLQVQEANKMKLKRRDLRFQRKSLIKNCI